MYNSNGIINKPADIIDTVYNSIDAVYKFANTYTDIDKLVNRLSNVIREESEKAYKLVNESDIVNLFNEVHEIASIPEFTRKRVRIMNLSDTLTSLSKLNSFITYIMNSSVSIRYYCEIFYTDELIRSAISQAKRGIIISIDDLMAQFSDARIKCGRLVNNGMNIIERIQAWPEKDFDDDSGWLARKQCFIEALELDLTVNQMQLIINTLHRVIHEYTVFTITQARRTPTQSITDYNILDTYDLKYWEEVTILQRINHPSVIAEYEWMNIISQAFHA